MYSKEYYKIMNDIILKSLNENNDKIEVEDIKNDKNLDNGKDVYEDLNKTADLRDEKEVNPDPDQEVEPVVEDFEDEDYGDLEDSGDADYLSAGIDPNELAEIEQITKVSDSRKKVMLHDYFINLHNNIKRMIEAVEEINTQRIEDSSKLKTLFVYKDALVELERKTEKFILKESERSNYEEYLYMYILLRTEFATTIRMIRRLLKIKNFESDNNN